MDRMDTNGAGVITLTLPSRLELLPVLDRLVQGIAEEMEFDEDDANAIAISVIEAGTNAIQHGHGERPEELVEFRFNLGPEGLVISVRDQGPGFDLQEVLAHDPTTGEDLLKSSGRGIFIMRRMMDRVDFFFEPPGGTEVRLTKARRSNGRETG